MRLGLCGRLHMLTELALCPVEYLEVHVQDVLVPEAGDDEFERNRAYLRRLPVTVEAANTLFSSEHALIETPSQRVDHRRLERYVRTAIDRAGSLGVRIIVLGSGAARRCPPDLNRTDAARQVGQHLARWSVWAHGSGIRFALEPLRYAESNVINTVSEADAVLQTIAGAGAGLLVDLYHMACNRDSPDNLLACRAPLLHVHVAEEADRAPPGKHGEDFRQFFAALRETGYDDRVSIECNWEDPAAEAGTAMQTVREQWESAGASPHV